MESDFGKVGPLEKFVELSLQVRSADGTTFPLGENEAVILPEACVADTLFQLPLAVSLGSLLGPPR